MVGRGMNPLRTLGVDVIVIAVWTYRITLGWLLGTSLALSAILGMAGYFSGVVQAPMTAFVIIIEMTGSHEAVIPVMAASMIGYVTSRLIAPEPLYHGLSRAFIAQAIRQQRSEGRSSGEDEVHPGTSGNADQPKG